MLPALLWGAAALLGGIGVAKGIEANDNFDAAEEIGKKAQKKQQAAEKKLAAARALTNSEFESLGRLKVTIFKNQIQHLVDVIRKSKDATSKLQNFECEITVEELQEMERLVLGSLEIDKGLASGAATGALAAMGAYSAVGTLAAASTGTAIAGLSGAAATNATLAWLGGGALGTAGGFARRAAWWR